ncbi:MAG TPA: ankyrin repeat domain-containing protein, partial [Pyrinomonadaceae bacterium]|nr:ankyrin repeat domain-containing protein [Pyrinomonadaceae bacterium]
MKKIFLVMCMCLSGVMCAAQAKTQGAANEQLFSCVKDGDANCVARSLAAGADANAVDEDGNAVLTLAAEGKSAAVVKLLLNAGAEVNGRPGKSVPLCRAAVFGREEITETLLGAGAKVNAVCDDAHGDTSLLGALFGAMLTGMPTDGIEELAGTSGDGDGEDENVDAGAKDEESDDDKKLREVLSVPHHNFLAVARLLLARGADVNVDVKCEMGETALMLAAASVNVELVREVLS